MRVTSPCLTALCLLIVFLSGCRESAQPTPTPTASDIQVNLRIEPEPAHAGDVMLLMTVTDATGQALEVAQIAVRGDMTHAGMAPVLGEAAQPDDDNVYRVPFEWTMGGDWSLTVDVTLADGRTASQRFDFVVES